MIWKRFKYLVALVHSSHDLKMFLFPITITSIIFKAKCLLLVSAGWEVNGGTHHSLHLAKFWNSIGVKNKSEQPHTEASLSLLEQSHGSEWSCFSWGLVWNSLCSFLSMLPHVFAKIFESHVLSFISNTAHLLDRANTLLHNFNSALRNMLWFIIVIANNCNRFIC